MDLKKHCRQQSGRIYTVYQLTHYHTQLTELTVFYIGSLLYDIFKVLGFFTTTKFIGYNTNYIGAVMQSSMMRTSTLRIEFVKLKCTYRTRQE